MVTLFLSLSLSLFFPSAPLHLIARLVDSVSLQLVFIIQGPQPPSATAGLNGQNQTACNAPILTLLGSLFIYSVCRRRTSAPGRLKGVVEPVFYIWPNDFILASTPPSRFHFHHLFPFGNRPCVSSSCKCSAEYIALDRPGCSNRLSGSELLFNSHTRPPPVPCGLTPNPLSKARRRTDCAISCAHVAPSAELTFTDLTAPLSPRSLALFFLLLIPSSLSSLLDCRLLTFDARCADPHVLVLATAQCFETGTCHPPDPG